MTSEVGGGLFLEREKPSNLRCEPLYPGIKTVVFFLKYPDDAFHSAESRCSVDFKRHLISECGLWRDDKPIQEKETQVRPAGTLEG